MKLLDAITFEYTIPSIYDKLQQKEGLKGLLDSLGEDGVFSRVEELEKSILFTPLFEIVAHNVIVRILSQEGGFFSLGRKDEIVG